jgi:hypothetical protein
MPVTAIDSLKGLGADNQIAPPRRMAIITPSDTDELAYVTTCIAFATAGAIKVKTAEDQDVVIASGMLAAGMWHAMQVKKIYDTGTTETSFLVGY